MNFSEGKRAKLSKLPGSIINTNVFNRPLLTPTVDGISNVKKYNNLKCQSWELYLGKYTSILFPLKTRIWLWNYLTISKKNHILYRSIKKFINKWIFTLILTKCDVCVLHMKQRIGCNYWIILIEIYKFLSIHCY